MPGTQAFKPLLLTLPALADPTLSLSAGSQWLPPTVCTCTCEDASNRATGAGGSSTKKQSWPLPLVAKPLTSSTRARTRMSTSAKLAPFTRLFLTSSNRCNALHSAFKKLFTYTPQRMAFLYSSHICHGPNEYSLHFVASLDREHCLTRVSGSKSSKFCPTAGGFRYFAAI